ncbi:MAG: hypothetical protein KatS3mg111_2696 [Pirellulaceae bacterium]|nr:MAG: hypothetical protein KatS3mg111_2696 [Pirellulaceae bacterium]
MLAVAWMVCSFLMWLAAIVGPPRQWSPGWGSSLAVVAFILATCVRAPLLMQRSVSAYRAAGPWILLWIDVGWLNLIGAVALQSAAIGESLIAIVGVGIAEAWLAHHLQHAGWSRWQHWRELTASLSWAIRRAVELAWSWRGHPPRSRPPAAERPTATTSPAPATMPHAPWQHTASESASPSTTGLVVDFSASLATDQPPGILDDEASATQDSEIMSGEHAPLLQLITDVDEAGQRYLSGSMIIDFAPAQREAVLALAFPQPFGHKPTVHFELSDPDVDAVVVRVTETGLRLRCKRSSTTGPLRCTCEIYVGASSSNESPSLVDVPPRFDSLP